MNPEKVFLCLLPKKPILTQGTCLNYTKCPRLKELRKGWKAGLAPCFFLDCFAESAAKMLVIRYWGAKYFRYPMFPRPRPQAKKKTSVFSNKQSSRDIYDSYNSLIAKIIPKELRDQDLKPFSTWSNLTVWHHGVSQQAPSTAQGGWKTPAWYRAQLWVHECPQEAKCTLTCIHAATQIGFAHNVGGIHSWLTVREEATPCKFRSK